MKKALILALAVAAYTTSASAATLTYTSVLTGDQEPTPVATDARGYATVDVDTVSRDLSVRLSVTGITLSGLFDGLVDAPVGPVHLHNAPPGVNGPIAVPFAFALGNNYVRTDSGFDLIVENINYDVANAIVGSNLSFDDFLSELDGGNVYFNVHTDFAPGGEIRGDLAPVPLPASGFLLLAAVGGIAAIRRASKSEK